MSKGRFTDFTLAEAVEVAKRNDPGEKVPSVSRVLLAEIARLGAENERLREIATTFLPVMESMRPLVLNLERLKDAATLTPATQ